MQKGMNRIPVYRNELTDGNEILLINDVTNSLKTD